MQSEDNKKGFAGLGDLADNLGKTGVSSVSEENKTVTKPYKSSAQEQKSVVKPYQPVNTQGNERNVHQTGQTNRYQPTQQNTNDAHNENRGVGIFVGACIAFLIFISFGLFKSKTSVPKKRSSQQYSQKQNTAKKQVNSGNSTNNKPVSKPVATSALKIFINDKNRLNDRIYSLVDKINATNPKYLGQSRPLYNEGIGIYKDIGACIKKLDNTVCSDNYQKEALRNLFILQNDRVVALVNGIIEANHGRNHVPEFDKGGEAKEKYDIQNERFEKKYE